MHSIIKISNQQTRLFEKSFTSSSFSEIINTNFESKRKGNKQYKLVV